FAFPIDWLTGATAAVFKNLHQMLERCDDFRRHAWSSSGAIDRCALCRHQSSSHVGYDWPGGLPLVGRTTSIFKPSRWIVRATKARALNLSFSSGCALVPVLVRIMTPSASMIAS